MAVTVTQIKNGTFRKIWTIVADADADTTATIAHGFTGITGPADLLLIVTGILFIARLSGWILDSVDATNIVVKKSTTATTGNAFAQCRVEALFPHSLIE